MNNETIPRQYSTGAVQIPAEPAASAGALVHAGRKPPSREQQEQFLAALLTTPHFGRACAAAGISRAAGYRLTKSSPEFAEAVVIARDLYLRDVLDAAHEAAVEGYDPTNPPARIRDNKLLAAVLRALLGGSQVNVNVNQNNGTAPAAADPDRLQRIRELLGGQQRPVIDGAASEVPAEAAPLSGAPDASGDALPPADGSDLI